MMRRPLLYVLVVLSVLGVVATSHALLGARLRASASPKRPLHIDTTVKLGTLSASGGGSAAPVQIASAVQLGTLSATGGGNAYPTGIALGAALGSVTRSVNGVVVNDDSFSGTSLNPNWTSFGPWDEVYTYALGKLVVGGGLLGTAVNSSSAGGYWASSNSDTSKVTIKAEPSATCYKGPTVRSGGGTSTTPGRGYSVYLALPGSGRWSRAYIEKNGSILGYGSVSISTASDHVLKLVATGTSTVTLTAYVDSVQVATVTDSSAPISSGHPGVFITGGSSVSINDTYLDNWSDNDATVLADWTSKPPAGTALRTDGHWSVTGLVAAYPLNEGTGLPKDVVSNVSGVSMTGGVTWGSDGVTSTGVTLSRLRMPNTTLINDAPASYTYISAVTYGDANPQGATFASIGGGPYISTYGIDVATGVFKASRATSTVYPSFTTTNTVPVGTKTTLAAVFNPLGTAPKAYINGVECSYSANATGGGTVTSTTGRNVDMLSNYNNEYGFNFKGGLHWMYIYNRALTASEIASLSANPWQIFQPH